MDTSHPVAITNSKLAWLASFGIAMGLLEAIVVVYLRELYFPDGFQFPLQSVPGRMLRLEILREFSTLAMLIALAMAAGQGFLLRLAAFLFTFGTWDLCYYVFLKALLDWPRSLLTWDVLFLIPVTWLGPVLAPILCALTMIGLAVLWIALQRRRGEVRTSGRIWLLMGAGAFLIFVTFIEDAAGIIIKVGFLSDHAGPSGSGDLLTALETVAPVRYNWTLFSLGEALVLFSGFKIYQENAGR